MPLQPEPESSPVQPVEKPHKSFGVSLKESALARLNFLRGIGSRQRQEMVEAPQPKTFDVITEQQIEEYKIKLKNEHDLDLSDVNVHIVKPGDELFDKQELIVKFMPHLDDPKYSELREMLESYDREPGNITVKSVLSKAAEMGIILDGKLPGFAITYGHDNIFFFAIHEDNAQEMARNYARKEREERDFETVDEAKDYLKELGKTAFLHEAGHIKFGRNKEDLFPKWREIIAKHPDLRDRVIEIQRDKYEDESEIPVEEEAFADWFVCMVDPKLKTRLMRDLIKVQFDEAGVSGAIPA